MKEREQGERRRKGGRQIGKGERKRGIMLEEPEDAERGMEEKGKRGRGEEGGKCQMRDTEEGKGRRKKGNEVAKGRKNGR